MESASARRPPSRRRLTAAQIASHLASLPGAPQPGQKIFPDELWEGQTGDLLRAIGMKPDDESNFVPTKESIDARIARDKAAHEARWAELNRDVAARTNGGSVQPFFLIPEPCWNGELGDFLVVTLKLSPYQDWNVAFLPADERTASMMNLPVHPDRDDPEVVEYAMGFVVAARDHYKECYEEVDRTREFGRFNDQIEEHHRQGARSRGEDPRAVRRDLAGAGGALRRRERANERRTTKNPPRFPAAGFCYIDHRDEVSSVLGRPGSDLLFQALRLSTIGAGEFNGRVRDGIGYRLPANTTRPAKDE